jgi:hypothetical protein
MKRQPVWPAAFALASLLLGVAPAPPSAEEYYARAVAQMRGQPVPAFATYDATITGLNCRVQGDDMSCTLGAATPQAQRPIEVALRESDGRAALRQGESKTVVGDSTFLDATWPGVDAIIRNGFTGTRVTEPHPSTSAQPTTLPVIAVVTSLSVENYRVYDDGAKTCVNGADGHAVRLVARRDPLKYPLTEAIVDVRSGDLCAVRFNAKVEGPIDLVGATAGAWLDLQSRGRYVVVSNERFDIDIRAIGIAVKHVHFEIAYSDFAFPKSIGPEVFVTPSPRS